MARRVRFEAGQPLNDPGCDWKLTKDELDFLNEATQRANEANSPGCYIPRIRFLHERIDHASNEPDIAVLQEEAAGLFRLEWERCECSKKLILGNAQQPLDLYTVFLVAQFREEYKKFGITPNGKDWGIRVQRFFKSFGGDERYTTGTRIRTQNLEEAKTQLDSFAKQCKNFVIR